MRADAPGLIRAGVALLAAGCVLTSPSLARAQADTLGLQGERDAPELLTAIPENPAFVYLAVTPTNITRPGSIRDFGAAVTNVIDENGKLKQGVALEASPWFFIPGLNIPLKKYQSNWPAFVLANTQLSFATAQTSGDSAATDMALGIRFTLFDAADPMRDTEFTDKLGPRLRNALTNCEALTDEDPDIPEELVQKCVDREMRKAYEEFSKQSQSRWNALRLALAVATGWQFANSDLGMGKSSGLSTWLVGAAPVGDFGQLIGQLTYTHRPALAEDSKFDLFSYGARLALGSATFNGFLEVLGESRGQTTDDTDDASGLWSAGIEFRVGTGLWLSTGFGSRFASLDKAERTFVVADIRFGVTDGSRLQGLRTASQ